MTDAGLISERDAWIALASAPGVGDVTFQRLLAAFGSAAAVLAAASRTPYAGADAAEARLARRLGLRLRPGLLAALRRAAADPGSARRRMKALGGWVLTPLDVEYPASLHELEDPPAVVFGVGSPARLTGPRHVAVVGTRRPTGLARDLAARVATRLVQAGGTVISGLAVGIDGAAHAAALDAGGRTIAVVGSGLDDPCPAVHRRLARSITATGAVISELAPGVRATQGTFPRRNRIISALARATIVVEAPARSGALITARHALEQGRILLVLPGRPLDPAVAGNLALLRETPARPLVGLDEMIVDLGLDVAPAGDPSEARPHLSTATALALLGESERAVALALSSGPRTIDSLARASGQSPGVVAAALTLLQLRGWARVLGAMQLPAGPLLVTRPGQTDADGTCDPPRHRRMAP